MQRLIQSIQQIFGEENTQVNPTRLPATPFGGVLLPSQGIAIHTVGLNSAYLHAVNSDFFAQWSHQAQQLKLHPVQIWEDFWVAKEPQVLSHLASLAGKTTKIFARNTIVRRISKPVADAFLNLHHIGGSPSARYKYGLFIKKPMSWLRWQPLARRAHFIETVCPHALLSWYGMAAKATPILRAD